MNGDWAEPHVWTEAPWVDGNNVPGFPMPAGADWPMIPHFVCAHATQRVQLDNSDWANPVVTGIRCVDCWQMMP